MGSPPKHIQETALGSYQVRQRFSTGVPQEFLKHAVPDYLVKGTDLFSLRLSNLKKKTAANTTIAIGVNESKLHLCFCEMGKKHIFWCAAEF